jgi:hypothetical protein
MRNSRPAILLRHPHFALWLCCVSVACHCLGSLCVHMESLPDASAVPGRGRGLRPTANAFGGRREGRGVVGGCQAGVSGAGGVGASALRSDHTRRAAVFHPRRVRAFGDVGRALFSGKQNLKLVIGFDPYLSVFSVRTPWCAVMCHPVILRVCMQVCVHGHGSHGGHGYQV